MLILIVLVKIKNWIVVEYIKWMLDDKVDGFLSRLESRNYVDCAKVKLALWKDCRRYCKTKAGGKGKTVFKYCGEKLDEYFDKLNVEISAASRDKGCQWEWAGILRLEQIFNQDKAMDLEANVPEEVKAEVEEHFHVELDAFMARFHFRGGDQGDNNCASSSFYSSLQGWYLSYDEVSQSLWRKFREEYGIIACEENGFELCMEHDPLDVISAFFTQIEGEIDEIYSLKDGNQEWEEAGETYFRQLCGKTLLETLFPQEGKNCPDSTEADDIDKSTPRSNHDNSNTYSGEVGDKTEEECSSFFEFFVIAAEAFLLRNNVILSPRAFFVKNEILQYLFSYCLV